MTVLLDVNVLIALIDPDHVAHDRAHSWFAGGAATDWATCPIVQNGVIRIVGARSYTDPPLGCPAVAATVRSWCAKPGHQFWPDDLSIVTATHIDVSRLLTSRQITDTYLLALAAARGGRLATLDRRLSTAAVEDGAAALHVIG